MRRAFIAAAACAAAIGFAAPACAVSLTFHVSVTDATGVDGFTPFAFDQTWTFEPNDPNTTSGGPVFPGFPYNTVETYGADDGITVTETAATQALIDALGPTTPSFPETHFNYRCGFSGDGAPSGPCTAGMTFGMTLVGASGFYHTEITHQSAAGFSTPAVNLAALLDFIATEGPLDYGVRSFDGTSFVTYAGTATLVGDGAGGVPEPATWALMILGLGAAGAALRARRRQAALA